MGGAHKGPPVEAKMQCTEEELRKNQVPLAFRDYCAHKLITLNKCRHKNFYMPFRCVEERNDYHKCQFEHYLRRVDEMKAKVKEEKRVARLAAEEAEVQ